MSPLLRAALEWHEAMFRASGSYADRLVVPRLVYEMLHHELEKEPLVADGDPVSGVGRDGRLWIAAIEVVADKEG